MTFGRAVLLPLLLLAGGAAGCVGNGEPANPNLLAPKVVLDGLEDGSYTVFVHSAIGERRYDSLVLLVDNETVVERYDVFSLEHRIEVLPAFVDVRAVSGTTQFSFRASLLPDPEENGVGIALVSATGEWSEPRRYSLPFERFLERPPVEATPEDNVTPEDVE